MKRTLKLVLLTAFCLTAGLAVIQPGKSFAAITPPGAQSGSVGLSGKIPSPPPKTGATIAVPGSGQTFTNIPITVSGLCPSGLLVKIFSNNVFVGAVQCKNGSYSIKIDLFSGRNDLVARVYDALNQAGPDSNVVRVTFNDAQYIKFGTHVSLTSNYAKRGANPGDTLTWPIILSGGSGPYAISVDWGDGTSPELISQSFPGNITLHHVYDSAGIYNITVRATDANGTTAFLQLVGVGNGPAAQTNNSANKKEQVTKTVVLWWPALVLIPLIGAAFWLGGRHELFTLRKNLEQHRD
jgi:hypothetical protein